MNQAGTLYLIEILHQTTTTIGSRHPRRSCILSKFYIKPQLLSPWAWVAARCILSKFYIKPQRSHPQQQPHKRCILSKFYIKPQLNFSIFDNGFSCILSKFYIKPQLARQWLMVPCVVSYRNSTSNHNGQSAEVNVEFVVSYRNSTSNHNTDKDGITDKKLYLIEILHQTTTVWPTFFVSRCCILSKFYIKPQLIALSFSLGLGCILSKFYIKPQQSSDCLICFEVVSYRNSTSNHNLWTTKSASEMLYLIEILHQTTTQRAHHKAKQELYLIEILHQTTTDRYINPPVELLYLIEILHQTTTSRLMTD